MQLTQLGIQRELERAKREGRWGDVEELEILLAALGTTPAEPPEPAETYMLQEGDDPFVVSKQEFGSVDFVPQLLQQNPASSWTPGTEIELPKIEEETNSGALVDLYETLGPPGENWRPEDWAVLDAVRAEIEAGQAPSDGGDDELDPEQVDPGSEEVETEEVGEGSAAQTASGELPPKLEDIELPEEQAEAVAQYMAQWLLSGELGDPMIWSPERVGVPGSEPRQKPAGQDSTSEGQTQGNIDEGAKLEGEDSEYGLSPEAMKDWETISGNQFPALPDVDFSFKPESPFSGLDTLHIMQAQGRENYYESSPEILLQDYLFSLIVPGSGPDRQWTADDWSLYASWVTVPNGETKWNRDRIWKGNTQWPYDSEPGLERFRNHVATLAGYYSSDEVDDFVRAFALVWGGIEYQTGWIAAAVNARGGPTLPTLFEGEEGFAEGFLDSKRQDFNPAHHYAGLFFLGYFNPAVGVNLAVNTARDYDNPGDIRLGQIAIAHGELLREHVENGGEDFQAIIF